MNGALWGLPYRKAEWCCLEVVPCWRSKVRKVVVIFPALRAKEKTWWISWKPSGFYVKRTLRKTEGEEGEARPKGCWAFSSLRSREPLASKASTEIRLSIASTSRLKVPKPSPCSECKASKGEGLGKQLLWPCLL